MKSAEIFTFSHQGGRPEQQDAVENWSNNKALLTVLADGVGGNIGGAAASQAVIVSANIVWNSTKGYFSDPESKLKVIAKDAHDNIRNLNPRERRSPATTIVALYICGDRAHWIHCGDSRLYRLRGGKIVEKTRDHSIVQILLEKGEISPEQVNTHPDKSRILRTLGSNTYKGVEYGSASCEDGDIFLLCSDGYWESVPHSSPILPTRPTSQLLQDFTTDCVKQAVERNGPKSDNTTLALIAFNHQKKTVSCYPAVFWRLIIGAVVLFVSFFLFLTWQSKRKSKELPREEEAAPAISNDHSGALPSAPKDITEALTPAAKPLPEKTKSESLLPNEIDDQSKPENKEPAAGDTGEKTTDSPNFPAKQ